jgi:hypothetical protein
MCMEGSNEYIENQGFHGVGMVVLHSRIYFIDECNQSPWNWMNSAVIWKLCVNYSESVTVKLNNRGGCSWHCMKHSSVSSPCDIVYLFFYYYLLQLGFHLVAVVLTLVHTIQMDI